MLKVLLPDGRQVEDPYVWVTMATHSSDGTKVVGVTLHKPTDAEMRELLAYDIVRTCDAFISDEMTPEELKSEEAEFSNLRCEEFRFTM